MVTGVSGQPGLSKQQKTENQEVFMVYSDIYLLKIEMHINLNLHLPE